MDKVQTLQKIADRLRIHSLKMTTGAGSGHPTTCLSMAELAACLFFGEMRYNIKNPYDLANDEFVLSKGHAAPMLWAAYAEAGIIAESRLSSLRKINSPLEGHPTPRMKWVKAATGSLGQGLSVGVGLALAMKTLSVDRRVYVLMGDGECAEGAVWEAANSAAHFRLHNLCAVVDVNRLGQSDATMHQHDLKAYARKFKAFGWDTIVVDGHDIAQVLEALEKAKGSKKPFVILAQTLKGKGVPFIEDKNGWHGKPLKKEELARALEAIGPMPDVDSKKYVREAGRLTPPSLKKGFSFPLPRFTEKKATRRAYGDALLALGKVNETVVCIDGDVKNSTYAEDFMEAFPRRSFQSFIAEQNMIGMGIGMSARGLIPFIATFATFLNRAHDQIRMASYSQANLKIVGSHVGVSIGEDGPSQMGLEDLAIFRPIPGCVVLYPSDAYCAAGCVKALARHKGISYLRTTRPATPLLYDDKESFPIGGYKVLRKSSGDRAAVIAAGITVFEALKAYESLKASGIRVRVIDAYSIKPLDGESLLKQIRAAKSRAVVVEDHFPEGGLGEAVASALRGRAELAHLAVRELPRSGKPEQLLDKYGISAAHIETAVRQWTTRGR